MVFYFTISFAFIRELQLLHHDACALGKIQKGEWLNKISVTTLGIDPSQL